MMRFVATNAFAKRVLTPLPGPPADSVAPSLSDVPSPSPALPLLVWLAVQFAAIAVALLRVPLAAGYPATGELLAAPVMVVVQGVASAALFPFLMRGRACAAAVVAAAWPFVVLAGVVSAAPAARVMAAGAYVSAWLVALWAWRATAPRREDLYAVAAALLLTAGTLLLFYLRVEFAPEASADASDLADQWAIASPTLAAMRQLREPLRGQDWCIPAGVVGVAAVRWFFARRRRQLIHNS